MSDYAPFEKLKYMARMTRGWWHVKELQPHLYELFYDGESTRTGAFAEIAEILFQWRGRPT